MIGDMQLIIYSCNIVITLEMLNIYVNSNPRCQLIT